MHANIIYSLCVCKYVYMYVYIWCLWVWLRWSHVFLTCQLYGHMRIGHNNNSHCSLFSHGQHALAELCSLGFASECFGRCVTTLRYQGLSHQNGLVHQGFEVTSSSSPYCFINIGWLTEPLTSTSSFFQAWTGTTSGGFVFSTSMFYYSNTVLVGCRYYVYVWENLIKL